MHLTDINTNKAVTEARKAERQYFEQHPLYRQIANRCGVEFLAKSLSKTLLHHIRDAMPELKMRVNSMLSQTTRDLESLGDPRLSQTKSALLLHVITKFNNQFCDTIEGRLAEYITDELYGGARINYIFEDVFGSYIKTMDPLGNLSTQEIQLTMSNATVRYIAPPHADFVSHNVALLYRDPNRHCLCLKRLSSSSPRD
jgi:dynamin 1-like protein